ncbi:MAG TPA: hypothetical protein VJP77_03885 [Planctomycetota bacterium]|nr:hypothetical protein [Planctomycetota bacterium]
MNALNRATTWLFDAALGPLEALGRELALVVVSGVFGILALIVFKHISWQKGIKGVKDQIKGGMIAIRIYQNDLRIVGKSVAKVLGRNLQYLGLNFGPILPLMVPFTLVAAQLVVRYGFEPVPVWDAAKGEPLAGQGVTLEVALERARRADVAALEVVLPEGLRAVSPLVRVAREGVAFQELVGTEPGVYDVVLRLPGVETTKRLVVGAGTQARAFQPERVSSFWAAWLWPAEDTLAGTPFERIAFVYPESDLRLLPGGPLGVLLTFLIASMAFGFLVLKPLGIQI